MPEETWSRSYAHLRILDQISLVPFTVTDSLKCAFQEKKLNKVNINLSESIFPLQK